MRIHFFAAACLLTAALLIASCKPTQPPAPPASPTPSASPAPTPTPIPYISRKPMDLARLFNGMLVETRLKTEQSRASAVTERDIPESYKLELTANIRIPAPATTAEELANANPKLPHILNDMSKLLAHSKVSPDFKKIYDLKIEQVRERLSQIDYLLSRHNFYDCDTILLATHPESGRRVVLTQGDMDVNTDGSDGDRNVPMDYSSSTFQPQTSYRWKKLTERPNPFISSAERKISEAKSANNRESKARIARLNDQIRELKRFSFLVSTVDPFIVLPTFMCRDKDNPFSPQLGDYAIVIHDNTLYPAIVGDVGPAYKMGEASLRICQQLNKSASGASRPVDKLEVTYLIFPGTADQPFTQPDLEKWRAACEKLLLEIGGSPVDLHQWENLVKPWPTPTPTPTPSPTPTATPSPSSSDSPSGSAQPTLTISASDASPSPAASLSPTPSPSVAPPSDTPSLSPSSTATPSPSLPESSASPQ